jgi:hypothetical protein
MNMADDFDPYLAWLGIATTARPPSHYQLLGVAEFEVDGAKIASAADRRMAEIRSYQTGPRGRYTQKLLNELSLARRCLLDPRTKSAYDQGLAQQRMAPATCEPMAPPLAEPPAAPPPARLSAVFAAVFLPRGDATDSAEPDANARWWLPFGVLFAMIIVGVGGTVFYLWPPPSKRALVAETKPKVSPVIPPEPEREPIITQEGSGDLGFPLSVAELSGALVAADQNGATLITGWRDDTTIARWNFKLVRPAVFQVQLVYVAEGAGNGQWELQSETETKTRDIEAGATTDEFFWRIHRGGEQTFALAVSGLPEGASVTLKSIRLKYEGGQLK